MHYIPFCFFSHFVPSRLVWYRLLGCLLDEQLDNEREQNVQSADNNSSD